ncbi:hypothetical protein DXU77_14325 [Pseudomonas lactis]|nr:hypothetical protein [Pseudomonas lactis]
MMRCSCLTKIALVRLKLFVGASLLAKNSQTPRSFRMHALSLTFFASKLAPTDVRHHTHHPPQMNPTCPRHDVLSYAI